MSYQTIVAAFDTTAHAQAAVEAPRPTGIGQIETEDTDVVAAGRLTGDVFQARIGFQRGIFLLEGDKGRLGHLLGVGHVAGIDPAVCLDRAAASPPRTGR